MPDKPILLLLLTWYIAGACSAQAYIDIANVKGIISPDAGIFRRNNSANELVYYSFSSALPIKLSKKENYIIISPFIERWVVNEKDFSAAEQDYNGLCFPVTYAHELNSHFSLSGTFIARWNGHSKLVYDDAFQYGAAVLFNWKKSTGLKYKFGLYYNRDEFGNFIVPLLGIDWQIDKNTILTGTLPGSLMLEKNSGTFFYYGIAFRAITNSYNRTINQYIRIDDNRVMLFADYYVTKHLVINTELGHSVFRQLRYGNETEGKQYFYKKKVKDNLLLQVSLAYRIRLL